MITKNHTLCDHCGHMVSGSEKHSHFVIIQGENMVIVSYHAPCLLKIENLGVKKNEN